MQVTFTVATWEVRHLDILFYMRITIPRLQFGWKIFILFHYGMYWAGLTEYTLLTLKQNDLSLCITIPTNRRKFTVTWLRKGSQELVVVIMGAMLVHPIEMAHLDFYYVAWTYIDHRSENEAFGGRKVRVCAVTTWRVFFAFVMVFFFLNVWWVFSPAYANVFGVGFSHA